MIICYPYDDSIIKDRETTIGFSYRGYKTAWKEIVLRTIEANPDVEIAQEFKDMFL